MTVYETAVEKIAEKSPNYIPASPARWELSSKNAMQKAVGSPITKNVTKVMIQPMFCLPVALTQLAATLLIESTITKS